VVDLARAQEQRRRFCTFSMRKRGERICFTGALLVLFCFFMPLLATAQERREREPNSVYAARRTKLAAEVDAPIVLWGFTGREEASQTYIFEQEESFYYLTGHNEEGAALVILPATKGSSESGAGARDQFVSSGEKSIEGKMERGAHVPYRAGH